MDKEHKFIKDFYVNGNVPTVSIYNYYKMKEQNEIQTGILMKDADIGCIKGTYTLIDILYKRIDKRLQ